MDIYVGTKIIKARPCTVAEFSEEVRLISYSGTSQEGYLVEYEDGYLSWSPKDVFEKAYNTDGNLTFGQASELAMSHRKLIARKSWNGAGQYVTVIPAGNAMFQGHNMQDCLGLKNVKGEMQPGWVPSQGDLFAKDWMVVGEW